MGLAPCGAPVVGGVGPLSRRAHAGAALIGRRCGGLSSVGWRILTLGDGRWIAAVRWKRAFHRYGRNAAGARIIEGGHLKPSPQAPMSPLVVYL